MKKTISLLLAATMAATSALAQNLVELDLKAKNAFLIDYKTNTVLYNKQGDEAMHPSSMSKMMTAYVVFNQLKEGKITLEQEFPVSIKAQKIGGSTMFLQAGYNVKVKDLLQGMIVQSGNDACITLAEGISGSEEAFVSLMNVTAKRLGLNNTQFANATGMPDAKHLMSARDLTKLAQALIRDFPEFYHYHQQKTFTYNNITQPNRNTLIGENGVDGLKTGHTEIAGYGLTASSKINDRRVIAVVNGLSSMRQRAEEARKLLTYGHTNFHNTIAIRQGEVLGKIPVWHGKDEFVEAVANDDIVLTIPNHWHEKLLGKLEFDAPIKAPITKGDKVAELVLSTPLQGELRLPLYAKEGVAKTSFFGRILYGIKYYKYKFFG
jgi:D-alanyl-D-alanine carboxypeptidase (penicillin-binding protein 5/6)